MIDPTVQLAIVGLIGTIVTGVGGFFGTIIVSKLNKAATQREQESQIKRVENAVVANKLEDIHVQTNSNIQDALIKIQDLQSQVSELKK